MEGAQAIARCRTRHKHRPAHSHRRENICRRDTSGTPSPPPAARPTITRCGEHAREWLYRALRRCPSSSTLAQRPRASRRVFCGALQLRHETPGPERRLGRGKSARTGSHKSKTAAPADPIVRRRRGRTPVTRLKPERQLCSADWPGAKAAPRHRDLSLLGCTKIGSFRDDTPRHAPPSPSMETHVSVRRGRLRCLPPT
jgi:hypothetical protein